MCSNAEKECASSFPAKSKMVNNGLSINLLKTENTIKLELASVESEYNSKRRAALSGNNFPKKTAQKKNTNTMGGLNMAATKRVSFETDTSLVPSLHRHDYTAEEKRNCWYSHADCLRMKQERQPTIEFIKANEKRGVVSRDTREHCIRGLETKTPLQATRRGSNQILGWRAVLEAQKLKSRKDVKVAEVIARTYKEISSKSLKKAYNVGLLDEIAAARAMRKNIKIPSFQNPSIQNGKNESSRHDAKRRDPCNRIYRSSSMHFPKNSKSFSSQLPKTPVGFPARSSYMHFPNFAIPFSFLRQ